MEDNNPSEKAKKPSFDSGMDPEPRRAEPTMTREEQTKLLSAMKDPDFRALLNEYMHEISDPCHREETEQYLAQLERDAKVPLDKQLIKPVPGFVVKTKWDGTEKLFLNVCSSAKLRPPSSTTGTSGPVGTSWHLPYSLGPERLEVDKGGRNVATFDICFHPRVLELAQSQQAYRQMVIRTGLSGLEPVLQAARRKQNGTLSSNFVVLKGIHYKAGDPVTMCLKKEMTQPVGNSGVTTKSVGNDQPPRLDKATVPLNHDQPTGLDKATVAPMIQKVPMAYHVTYRGRFELHQHLQRQVPAPGPPAPVRPRELVLTVSLPLLSSAKGLDLDVSERRVRLVPGPDVQGHYDVLEVPLTYPVLEARGQATFDRKKRELIVTLPVQPVPNVMVEAPGEMVPTEEEEEEEEEMEEEKEVTVEHVDKPKKRDDAFLMLRETALMVANDPHVLAWKQQTLEESAALVTNEDRTEVPCVPSTSRRVVPPFETHETSAACTYVVQVVGIDAASVHVTYPSLTSVRLCFWAKTAQEYELNVAKLPVAIEPSRTEVDVATENMVVVLYKQQPRLPLDAHHTIAIPAPRFQNQLVYELD